ncbi:unnamed protein product [Sphenostylis stenocarpa]|uniref:A20-type domain-containing protein n=1 Tax=Sphenostylis stenocarpa TaxID=92480 RepID=A0AA86SGT9_9FABA|nr:unnamed protein product [Sphenostylis stenocarpa]
MNPSFCANGCGFYGSVTNNNLCSQCYKDYIKENEIRSKEEPITNTWESSEIDVIATISLPDTREVTKNKGKRLLGQEKEIVDLAGRYFGSFEGDSEGRNNTNET